MEVKPDTLPWLHGPLKNAVTHTCCCCKHLSRAQAVVPLSMQSTLSPTPRGSPALKPILLGRSSPGLASPRTSRPPTVPSIGLKGQSRADHSPARSVNPPMSARSNLPTAASLRCVLRLAMDALCAVLHFCTSLHSCMQCACGSGRVWHRTSCHACKRLMKVELMHETT